MHFHPIHRIIKQYPPTINNNYRSFLLFLLSGRPFCILKSFISSTQRIAYKPCNWSMILGTIKPNQNRRESAKIEGKRKEENLTGTLELSHKFALNSPVLVPRGTTAATLEVSWSKVYSCVSLSKELILRSSGVIARTPHSPSIKRFHVVCTPQPRGVTMPIPVTTTRRGVTGGGGPKEEDRWRRVSW